MNLQGADRILSPTNMVAYHGEVQLTWLGCLDGEAYRVVALINALRIEIVSIGQLDTGLHIVLDHHLPAPPHVRVLLELMDVSTEHIAHEGRQTQSILLELDG